MFLDANSECKKMTVLTLLIYILRASGDGHTFSFITANNSM